MKRSQGVRIRLRIAALWLALLAGIPVLAGAARASMADLELVLAVDVSGSIDLRERDVQRGGYLAAIRSREFAEAVRTGPFGKIRLAYVEWAGDGSQHITVPWRLIDGAESAQAFADELSVQPGARFMRGTSISSALRFSAGLFEGAATRRVIDISGDGPNNAGAPVTEARDAAVADGIVVNGLPVLINPSPAVQRLDHYYADCVIGGEGSFMQPVAALADMEEAILMKLLRELLSAEYRAEGDIRFAAAEPPSDCLAGERDRGRRTDKYFPELDK